MEDINKKIEHFIDKNTNPMSRVKGQELYEEGAFELLVLETKDQIAEFLAYGTREYIVSIHYYQTPIKTSCSCPYNWGGLCKHTVGALLQLQDELKSRPAPRQLKVEKTATALSTPPSPKKRKPSPPALVSLGEVRMIDHNFGSHLFLKNHTPIYGDVLEINMSENQIRYLIETSTRYWDYYSRKENSLSFNIENGEIFLSCNCPKKNQRPCNHMRFVVEHIINSSPSNLFFTLTPEYKEQLFQKGVEDTGIPREKIHLYYQYDNKEGKLVPTKKAKGLIFINEERTLELKKEIQDSFLKKQFISLNILEKVTERQEQIGYVLWFPPKDHVPMVIAITGKPTPDRTEMKYIKNFSNAKDVLQKEKEDSYLLGLIDRYMDSFDYFDYRQQKQVGDHKIDAFNKFQDILSLLADREFVFFQLENGYSSSKNVKKSSLSRLKIEKEPIELFFQIHEDEFFFVLTPMLRLGNNTIPIETFGKNKLGNDYNIFGVFHKNSFWAFANLNEALASLNFFLYTSKVLRSSKNQFDLFYDNIILPLSKDYRIEFLNIKDQKIVHKKLVPQMREVFLSELSNFILFTPQVLYQEDIRTNILNEHSPLSKNGNEIHVYERDEKYEAEFRSLMGDLHPEFAKQHYDEFYYLPIASIMNDNWFFNTFEKLAEAKVEVYGINDLKSIKYSPYKAKISTGIKSGIDWFDVDIQLSFGEEQIKLAALKKAIMRNERFIKLSDGKLGVLPEEWFNKLQKIFRAGEVKKGEVKISKLRFNIVDELFEDIDDAEIVKELAAKKRKLKKFTQIKNVKIPENIQAELRDYQVAGYNWMNFLHEFKWGGLLADDMGLGKTLQALTFIQSQAKKSKKPNLAIVPTSLLFNWENEIKKFVPELKYVVYHGGDRKELREDIKKYQLIITSYGVITNDIEDLKKISFNYIFLDESQAIKNMASKRYKACRLLKAVNRIAMTGTPIENNTFDLYSQMNFLNPGFLGMATSFKTEYSKPIDGKGDQKIAKELQKMIAPFLLRRTKDQVAKELPPKIEDYIYCEMEEEQMKVYKAFRNKYRDYLLNKIEEDGLNKSKLHVLEGLLKLRQICDSPALLSDKEDYGDQSVKINTLLQHIREKTGNHKILIFSQFVKMLHLIRKELEKEGVIFEYLDGQCSPSKRNASVENFQNNEDCRVFLISLKAGGTGLNLTAADYVYIVDPWWNPAVENQAIDRTHRIGQDKHIIAYRMICKGTVEEKIMQYQQRKLKVAADIVQAEESFMKSLSSDDITDLFG